MEFRRNGDDGRVAAPGEWAGPFPSGAPAIFASVAARLGSPTALAATVGDDQFGRAIHARLHRDGVELDGLTLAPGRATAVAFVAYNRSGSRDFVFTVHDSIAVTVDRSAIERLASRADWLHVSGSTIGFGGDIADTAIDAAERIAGRGGRISLDPNVRADADDPTRERLRRLAGLAHVLFPSSGELDALGLSEQSLIERGAIVCQTQGAAGVTVPGRGRARSPRSRHAGRARLVCR